MTRIFEGDRPVAQNYLHLSQMTQFVRNKPLDRVLVKSQNILSLNSQCFPWILRDRTIYVKFMLNLNYGK